MPGTQPTCSICHHRIISKADGRTITAKHQSRLQTYTSHKIKVKDDRAHNKCWEYPHLHTKNMVSTQQPITYNIYI